MVRHPRTGQNLLMTEADRLNGDTGRRERRRVRPGCQIVFEYRVVCVYGCGGVCESESVCARVRVSVIDLST